MCPACVSNTALTLAGAVLSTGAVVAGVLAGTRRRRSSAAIPSPRTEDGPALRLAGLRECYSLLTCREIPAQWQRFAPRIEEIPGRVGGRAAFGVCLGMLREGRPTFEYLSAVEVGELPASGSPWSGLEIPAQRYVVFPHAGHVSELSATIAAACEWLPRSGFRAAEPAPGRPSFIERYGAGFDPQAGLGDVSVWFPVQEEK
jgi:AraC family transcriptional regulator